MHIHLLLCKYANYIYIERERERLRVRHIDSKRGLCQSLILRFGPYRTSNEA